MMESKKEEEERHFIELEKKRDAERLQREEKEKKERSDLAIEMSKLHLKQMVISKSHFVHFVICIHL